MSHLIRIGAFYRKELITWLRHFYLPLSPSTISLKNTNFFMYFKLEALHKNHKYRCDFKGMSKSQLSVQL